MTTDPRPAQSADPGTGPAPEPPANQPPANQPTNTQPTVGAPPELPQHTIHRTRISGLWVAIGCFTILLLFLLIFILQNSHSVDISYLGAHGHLPLGVALLLAAVCGVLLVLLAGTARILQLRATARRHRRADSR